MTSAHLPDPFLGKIILFERLPEERILALRASIDQEWWIDLQRGREPAQILAAIRLIPDAKDYDDSFGFHREIPHQGEVRGGGIALFLDGTFYLDCQSQAYGPLERARVAEILSRPQVHVLSKEICQIVIASDGKGRPFPFYLGRELR